MDYLGGLVGAVPSLWCWQKCLAQKGSYTASFISAVGGALGGGALEGGARGRGPKPHPSLRSPDPQESRFCHPLPGLHE